MVQILEPRDTFGSIIGRNLGEGFREGVKSKKEQQEQMRQEGVKAQQSKQEMLLQEAMKMRYLDKEHQNKLAEEVHKQALKEKRDKDLFQQIMNLNGLGQETSTPSEKSEQPGQTFVENEESPSKKMAKEGAKSAGLEKAKTGKKGEIAEIDKQIEQERKRIVPIQNQLATAFLKPEAARVLQSMVSNANARINHLENQKQKISQNEENKQEQRNRDFRAETKDFREEIAMKANAAFKGIENKERLIESIKTGKLDDPTFAAIATGLPFHLGERLLSNETVKYRSGLIDEYTDLRNIFQGQTRIKEIDLLEQKVADLYLTDEQKMGVLESRIEALKADVLKGEIAAEIDKENPYMNLLEFQNELNKRYIDRSKPIFEKILADQKHIIDSAEMRKKIPLNMNDPEDKKIFMQIYEEAGRDKAEARKLAKKKGYTY